MSPLRWFLGDENTPFQLLLPGLGRRTGAGGVEVGRQAARRRRAEERRRGARSARKERGTRGATFRGGVVGVSPALCSRVVLAGRLGREGDKGKETRSRSPRALPRPLHGGLGEF